MFRMMNSDTLDLGGKRRGPTHMERCRGYRCGHRVPPTADMQGEGAVASTAAVSLTLHSCPNTTIRFLPPLHLVQL
jgi:hypothetical protein